MKELTLFRSDFWGLIPIGGADSTPLFENTVEYTIFKNL